MKKWSKYIIVTWFGCFASIAEGILFIKQQGATCRLEKK